MSVARAQHITRDRGRGNKRQAPSPVEFKGRAYATRREDDLDMAVLRFANDWLSDFRLGDRRPNEIEVFLTLSDGQLVTVTLRGEKMIDAVLDGDAGPLRDQIVRLGIPAAALIPSSSAGPLEGVELASSRFFPLSVQEYEQRRQLLDSGVAFADLPPELRKRARRVTREYMVGTEFFSTKRAADKESARTGREVEVVDYRNAPAVESFLSSALGKQLAPIPVARIAPGASPREQVRAAISAARRQKRPVNLAVQVQGRTIQVAPPSGRVGRIKRPSGAVVQVVRGGGGKFASTFDAATRLAVYEEAEARGFSKVSRELGIPRGTIYGWKP